MDKFIKIKTVEDLREAVEHDLLYHCGEPLQTTDYLIAKDLFYGKYEMLNPDYVEPVNFFNFLDKNGIGLNVLYKNDRYIVTLAGWEYSNGSQTIFATSRVLGECFRTMAKWLRGQQIKKPVKGPRFPTYENVQFPENMNID